MTDYERLTRYMQVGNKVVQVIPQRKERIQAYIDRLFDLEDKIESSELISKKEVERLQNENASLRSGMQYLIDDGGADCCARCIYCPQPTEEDDDCDCQHKGECVDGMIKWFEEQREEQQGGTE